MTLIIIEAIIFYWRNLKPFTLLGFEIAKTVIELALLGRTIISDFIQGSSGGAQGAAAVIVLVVSLYVSILPRNVW